MERPGHTAGRPIPKHGKPALTTKEGPVWEQLRVGSAAAPNHTCIHTRFSGKGTEDANQGRENDRVAASKRDLKPCPPWGCMCPFLTAHEITNSERDGLPRCALRVWNKALTSSRYTGNSKRLQPDPRSWPMMTPRAGATHGPGALGAAVEARTREMRAR